MVFFSHYFLATNGVKQDDLPSPILFCIYIDGKLQMLTASSVGCYMGSVFIRALAFADDIILIAPSATAMRKQLSICNEYDDEYHIMFNAQQSRGLAFIPKHRFFSV
jgi:hypothetical protein